ncbi:MAG TPA: glycosyltransferase, partial [Solirubrobacteraceae bacterium]|nr:glycosyltransferase [Solirubrobacteraceae bacterium]
MMTSAVTCLVCAYNYEGYIAEAIESALAQDYPADRLEVLVIDDGSTDRTPEILAGFGDRIRVIRQENAGLNAATARGIAEARGELIALLDADDAWLPDKLRRQVDLLHERPEVGLVFCDCALVDADGGMFAPSLFTSHDVRPVRGPHALESLLAGNFVSAPTIVFRREHSAHVLPFPPEAPCQDWWLAVRISEVAELDFVPAPLVRVRVHEDSMSGIAGGGDLRSEAGRRNLLARRRDIVFRRWMLRTLPLDRVPVDALMAGWERHFELTVALATQAGTTAADEMPVSSEDREACRDALADANAALARGDLHAAARGGVAARAADPFDAGARALLADVLAAVDRADGAPGVVPLDLPAPALLAWAEERFGAGDAGAAVEALLTLAADGDVDDPALLGQIHADLAVIAHALGDAGTAAGAARESLRHDPGGLAALETLGRLALEAGDGGQAAHWFTRAAERNPDDADSLLALGRVEAERSRWAQAAAALSAAGELGSLEPGDEALLASARTHATGVRATACSPTSAAGRLLICVDHFYPSRGGSE